MKQALLPKLRENNWANGGYLKVRIKITHCTNNDRYICKPRVFRGSQRSVIAALSEGINRVRFLFVFNNNSGGTFK